MKESITLSIILIFISFVILISVYFYKQGLKNCTHDVETIVINKRGQIIYHGINIQRYEIKNFIDNLK